MGRVVAAIADTDPEISVVAGFDINCHKLGGFPVFSNPNEFSGDADIIIDFSHPSALNDLLKFSNKTQVPLILCATGYSQQQLLQIDKASERLKIFRSGNMSLGINLLADLVSRACSVLGEGFDIEIIERHHRRKIDAPSGTALMLADAASSSLPYEPEYIYTRHNRREPRDNGEIGFSSVRGGTIIGEHDIIFAGPDEVIELRHSAQSRDVFASGAVSAAKFMASVNKSGLYDMSDVLRSQNMVDFTSAR